MDPQVFFPAVKTEVVEIAQRNKALGYRFAQMHCVKTPSEMFIIYTFEKQDLSIEQYRIPAETDGAVPSVSGVFLAAVLYENEISELYGVEFTGMAIDFGGTLYETAKPRAFAEVAAPVKKPPVKKAAAAEKTPIDLKKPAAAEEPKPEAAPAEPETVVEEKAPINLKKPADGEGN